MRMLFCGLIMGSLSYSFAQQCETKGYYLYNQDGEAQAEIKPMVEAKSTVEKFAQTGASITSGYEEAGKAVVFLYHGLGETGKIALVWINNKRYGLDSGIKYTVETAIHDLPSDSTVLHSDDKGEVKKISPTEATGKWLFNGANTDSGSFLLNALSWWKVRLELKTFTQVAGPTYKMGWKLLLGPDGRVRNLDTGRDLYIENYNIRISLNGATQFPVPTNAQFFVSDIPAEIANFSLVKVSDNAAAKGSTITLQCCSETECTFLIGIGRCGACTAPSDGDLWNQHENNEMKQLGCHASYRIGTSQKFEKLALLARTVPPSTIVDLEVLPEEAKRLVFFQKSGGFSDFLCPLHVGPFPPGTPCTVC